MTTKEEALLQKFQEVPALADFAEKLKEKPDSIAFYLDHPERVENMVRYPRMYAPCDRDSDDDLFRYVDEPPDDDEENYFKYKEGKKINQEWFRQKSAFRHLKTNERTVCHGKYK